MIVNEASKTAVIQALPWLMPPKGVIHVGIGVGTGPMQKWRGVDVKSALLIDANLPQLNWLNNELPSHPQWLAQQAILAARQEEAIFHIANNPMESGLCEPDLFKNLWPSLAATNTQTQQTQTLDGLLHEIGALPENFDWLCVDCLPALDIIRGGQQLLNHVNVIWARAILNPQANQAEFGLEKLEDYLVSQGFKRNLIVEENHPALASVLFMRDWSVNFNQLNQATGKLVAERDAVMILAEDSKVQNQQLAEKLKCQINILAQYQQQIEQLTAERNAQTLLAEKQQVSVEKINHELEKQALQITDLVSKNQVLTKSCDRHAKLLVDSQAHIETLTIERDAALLQSKNKQKENEALLSNNETLKKEYSELMVRGDELNNEIVALAQARDEQTKLAAERMLSIEKFSTDRDTYAAQLKDLQGKIETLTQTNIAIDKERLALIERSKELTNEVGILIQKRDEQAKLADERKMRIPAIIQERDSHAKQAAKCLCEIESLKQSKEILEQEKLSLMEQLRIIQNEVATLKQINEERMRKTSKLQSRIDELTQKIGVYTMQESDQRKKIETMNGTLGQEKSALQIRCDELANEVAILTQNQNEQIKIAAKRNKEIDLFREALEKKQERIAMLESDAAEKDIRQRLLNEEMIKAEAQIDLIKDVLLREVGL